MRCTGCVVILIAVLCWAATARADQAAHGAGSPSIFSKGMWDIELGGNYAWEFYPYDRDKLASGFAGVGYYFTDNFAASLRVPIYHVNQRGGDADMYGLDLSLRYHFYQKDRLTFFGDLIGGLADASKQVPPGGTHFNFTAQGGVGATYQLADHLHLIGGVHVFHLSNAAIRGINRNPDLNAVQGYVGLMFTF